MVDGYCLFMFAGLIVVQAPITSKRRYASTVP